MANWIYNLKSLWEKRFAQLDKVIENLTSKIK